MVGTTLQHYRILHSLIAGPMASSRGGSVIDAGLPSWWPSGARIAFGIRLTLKEGRRGDIATIPAAGGSVVPVTQDPHLDWNPVWAPELVWGARLFHV